MKTEALYTCLDQMQQCIQLLERNPIVNELSAFSKTERGCIYSCYGTDEVPHPPLLRTLAQEKRNSVSTLIPLRIQTKFSYRRLAESHQFSFSPYQLLLPTNPPIKRTPGPFLTLANSRYQTLTTAVPSLTC
jgi:hypothetical protein